MTVRAVALLSGGLDSMLAIRLLQEQGVEVEALNFRTTFTCCQDQAAEAAAELGVRLSVVAEQDEYLEIVRNPRHGYGRGANPCIDCRIYMFRLAGQWMRETGAAMVISGEVVGQRMMSQKKRDLALVAHRARLDDRLLRPLSAKLLPVTTPECEKLVDREKLFGFSGRGRGPLIALARELGLKRIPQPSNGCALTEPGFATKVHDLLGSDPAADRWQFELLKIGRHVRFDGATKVVLGRRAEENEQLVHQFERYTSPCGQAIALLTPDDFLGPSALIVGHVTEATLDFAGGQILKHSRLVDGAEPSIVVRSHTGRSVRRIGATVSG
jgi:tRNA-uridine 2-sulfurtransferase